MASLFQFSIRSLLVAVTIAAVGVAALLNANLWWEGATWLVALGLLAVGILLCIYRRQEQRAYWLGFMIFGGLYLGLLLFTAVLGRYYELVPSQLSQLAYQSVIPAAGQSPYAPVSVSAGSPVPTVAYQYQVIASSPYSPPYLSSPATPQPAPLALAPATLPMPSTAAFAYAPSMSNPDYVSMEKFVSIGHSLWLLLVATIGGKVCQVIYRTRPQPES